MDAQAAVNRNGNTEPGHCIEHGPHDRHVADIESLAGRMKLQPLQTQLCHSPLQFFDGRFSMTRIYPGKPDYLVRVALHGLSYVVVGFG